MLKYDPESGSKRRGRAERHHPGKAANFYGVKRSINLVSDSGGRLASSRFNPLTD
jgi:hypothetical protein